MEKIIKSIRGSLSTQILIGLALGVLVGLFFGEGASRLAVVGDIYLRLFQMPVVPYIFVSLIGSLGALNYREARSTLIKGGIVILGCWVAILGVVAIFPLGFPNWKSATFFSTTLLEGGKGFKFVELFIPLNPFHSMANTVIPSLVLFCIATGFALISVPNKQGLLDTFASLKDSLLIITNFVAQLTPYGVFAISANAAGTLSLESFQRLQIYIILHAAVALFLSFWVLPAAIALLTPLKFKEVIGAYRTPLITAFATGNLLIVLPLIIEKSQQLLQQLSYDPARGEPEIDLPLEVLVPLSFIFPNMGKLLSLAFIPFAAWYNGSSVPLQEVPTFLAAGLASLFGDGIASMVFLMDLFSIPRDMLQIFVIADRVSASRFGTLLAGMNTIALALIATCAINGLVRVRRRRLIRTGIASILGLLVLLGSINLFFTYVTGDIYRGAEKLTNLRLLRVKQESSLVEVFTTPPPPTEIDPEAESRFDIIRERGTIKVCYDRDDFPLAYFNSQDPPELVGFDIEMAYILGQDLGVTVQLYPLPGDYTAAEDEERLVPIYFNEGRCDIIMTSVAITPNRARRVDLSTPIQDFTVAFLVRDFQREEFNSWSALKDKPLKIGSPGDIPYYSAKIKGLLPNSQDVPIDSMETALESGLEGLDAIAGSAETLSAWTLLYPNFAVGIPKPIVKVPVAYALPLNDPHFTKVIDTWLDLKQSDGTVASLYNYWVQGKTGATAPPRWSIIRDVLGWVD